MHARLTLKVRVMLVFFVGLWLATAVAGSELQHPLFRTIKRRDDDRVRQMLQQGTPVNLRAADGTTPLMIAALHGSCASVRLLLERGADPTAANDAGATALLWAVSDLEKVRLLLSWGAQVNVPSNAGVTPLLAAAKLPTGTSVVELLLAQNAEFQARTNRGDSTLKHAIEGGNLATTKLLFAHARQRGKLDELIGDDAARLLENASIPEGTEFATYLCEQLTEWNHGDLPEAGQAVATALLRQRPEVALILLERGAPAVELERPAKSPVALLAAYCDREDPSVFRALLKAGHDVTVQNEHQETALSWARRRGHVDLMEELAAAGVADVVDDMPQVPAREINLHSGNQQQLLTDAVSRSLALLLKSSDVFLKERSCTSCHQNDLSAIAAAWARDRGISVDHSALDRLITRQTSRRQIDSWIDRAYDMRRGVVFNARSIGMRLWEYSATGYPPDDHIEAMVWSVAVTQEADGHWSELLTRPPITGGNFSATAYAIYALQLYPLAGREAELKDRVTRAASWLCDNAPATHQDRVYQLLGAGWAGRSPEELNDIKSALLHMQRPDGGWAQFPNRPSDAWATGQSLIALHVAGGLPTSDSAYQRGLRYLLNTQFDDGSWWVQSRAFPFQEPFESGFPHGRDQWISSPATAWAAMAMTLALEPSQSKLPAVLGEEAPILSSETNKKSDLSSYNPQATNALQVDFTRDIQSVLERSCIACHSGDKPQGNLDMSLRESLLRGGDSGNTALTPGVSAESLLLLAASGGQDELTMPPEDERDRFPNLSVQELELLKLWIDDGAPWPEGVELTSGRY